MSEAKVTIMPIVNNNGTSKESLLFNYRMVMYEAKKALQYACEARPHGRDYQVNKEENAAQLAHDEYEEQVVKPLAAIADYLEALLIGISSQGREVAPNVQGTLDAMERGEVANPQIGSYEIK